MSKSKIEVRCQRETWNDGVEIVVFERHSNGHVGYAQPLLMLYKAEGELIGTPTMRLSNQEAQMLMDELWRCNLRPSEGSGSAGSLAATEKHLKDMQTIALGLLKKHGMP